MSYHSEVKSTQSFSLAGQCLAYLFRITNWNACVRNILICPISMYPFYANSVLINALHKNLTLNAYIIFQVKHCLYW